MNRLTRPQGFTLIEILVALVIFALIALAVIPRVGNHLLALSSLEDKATAAWIADNKLATLRLQKEWPDNGVQNDTVTMADTRWAVQTEVTSSSGNPDLRRVDVRVGRMAEGKSRQAYTLTLTTFMGHY